MRTGRPAPAFGRDVLDEDAQALALVDGGGRAERRRGCSSPQQPDAPRSREDVAERLLGPGRRSSAPWSRGRGGRRLADLRDVLRDDGDLERGLRRRHLVDGEGEARRRGVVAGCEPERRANWGGTVTETALASKEACSCTRLRTLSEGRVRPLSLSIAMSARLRATTVTSPSSSMAGGPGRRRLRDWPPRRSVSGLKARYLGRVLALR